MGEGNRSSSSGWTRNMSKVRSFLGNTMGGLRGGSNVASWAVAGTLAYFLWVKPSQDLKRQQQERVAAVAAAGAQSAQTQAQPEETKSVYSDSNTKPDSS